MEVPHLGKNGFNFFKNKSQINKTKRGYVTLLSVILLGALASIIVSTNILLVTDSTLAVASLERSKIAKALADTCAERAIDKLKVNLSYAGNETINLNGGSCTIGTITGTGNTNRVISITSTFNNVTRGITITVTTVDPITVIGSWVES